MGTEQERINKQQHELMERLRQSLTNHTPDETTIENIEWLRTKAKELGDTIITLASGSREQSLALTHLEETVMWAVKAMVLHHPEGPIGGSPR